jgi:hypothetical protein
MAKIKIYTGVGSRKTPREIQVVMFQLGSVLAKRGAILRSGAAKGADAAFERGCDAENGEKQIFLPWRGFNDHPSRYYDSKDEAFRMAAEIHPAWHRCQQAAQKLHARNCHQILGPDLDKPSDAVFFWAEEDEKGQIAGGTRTAVKLAEHHGIPRINLNHAESLGIILEYIERHQK